MAGRELVKFDVSNSEPDLGDMKFSYQVQDECCYLCDPFFSSLLAPGLASARGSTVGCVGPSVSSVAVSCLA